MDAAIVKALEHTSSDEWLIEKAQGAIDFVNSSPVPVTGSFAERAIALISKDPDHPYAALLQYPQVGLYVAGEHLKLVASIRMSFSERTPKIPLPMFAFLSLGRVVIENASIVIWLLGAQSETDLLERSIALRTNELSSFKAYARSVHQDTCVKTGITLDEANPHVNSSCQEAHDTMEVYEVNTKSFADSNSLKHKNLPQMTCNDPNQRGLLEQVMGKQLEILYRQLSGTIHGSNWAFQQNTIKTSTESPSSERPVVTAVHVVNEELIRTALSVSSRLLERAASKYTSLFHLDGPPFEKVSL